MVLKTILIHVLILICALIESIQVYEYFLNAKNALSFKKWVKNQMKNNSRLVLKVK